MLVRDENHVRDKKSQRRLFDDESRFGGVGIAEAGSNSVRRQVIAESSTDPTMTSSGRGHLAQLPPDNFDARVLAHLPDVVRRH
jgi:hypothetical protein